jgi:hypothetical protein
VIQWKEHLEESTEKLKTYVLKKKRIIFAEEG